MVCLPGIVRVCTLTTNVANNCIVSYLLRSFAISRRVENLFLGIALGNLGISSVVRSLMRFTAVLASAKSPADNTRSHKGHD